MTQAMGNAGRIYQGGFPSVGLRVNYWFDFHFALQTDVQNSKHAYDLKPDGPSDVNFFRVLFQLKYYFDTHDLSAPLTFIGPHLIVGGGFYQRTDNVGSSAISTSGSPAGVTAQTAFGFNGGVGLELTLKPKKTYLQFEGLMHFVSFADQYDQHFQKSEGIPDRSGNWIAAQVALMWTW